MCCSRKWSIASIAPIIQHKHTINFTSFRGLRQQHCCCDRPGKQALFQYTANCNSPLPLSLSRRALSKGSLERFSRRALLNSLFSIFYFERRKSFSLRFGLIVDKSTHVSKQCLSTVPFANKQLPIHWVLYFSQFRIIVRFKSSPMSLHVELRHCRSVDISLSGIIDAYTESE